MTGDMGCEQPAHRVIADFLDLFSLGISQIATVIGFTVAIKMQHIGDIIAVTITERVTPVVEVPETVERDHESVTKVDLEIEIQTTGFTTFKVSEITVNTTVIAITGVSIETTGGVRSITHNYQLLLVDF